MHDARAIVFALHVAQVVGPAMMHKSVHQRAVGVVDGRMAHQPRLFRDDQQIVVFVAHVKRNVLRAHRAGRRRLFKLVHHRVASRQRVFFGHRAPLTNTAPDSTARAAAERLGYKPCPANTASMR